jgi:predicted RNase H-like HicB family nuclease
MKCYHVLVEQDDQWFIGQVLERDGVITQGRSLDELLFMLRDAIALMWREKNVQLEFIIPNGAITSFERRKRRFTQNRFGPRHSVYSSKKHIA